ncbi:MAG: gas vesicle protein GvpG [Planctomycetes bacterium]|nr:gas vesicle protein GvpG [Planctomycetota bacterium]
MGLFSAPFRGLFLVFREVADRAEQELHDEDAVKAELTDIYMRLEAGTLSEEEFARREAALVQRLEDIEGHKRRKKRGSGRGGR